MGGTTLKEKGNHWVMYNKKCSLGAQVALVSATWLVNDMHLKRKCRFLLWGFKSSFDQLWLDEEENSVWVTDELGSLAVGL